MCCGLRMSGPPPAPPSPFPELVVPALPIQPPPPDEVTDELSRLKWEVEGLFNRFMYNSNPNPFMQEYYHHRLKAKLDVLIRRIDRRISGLTAVKDGIWKIKVPTLRIVESVTSQLNEAVDRLRAIIKQDEEDLAHFLELQTRAKEKWDVLEEEMKGMSKESEDPNEPKSGRGDWSGGGGGAASQLLRF